MDLGEILRVIRKRWLIMLPMTLVTLALTGVAYFQVPVKYQSTSQLSVLSPQQPASGNFRGQSNPFLIFDTSLTSTADLLSRSLTSDDSAKQLKAQGVTEEYTAKLADFATGPFIALTVTGTDSAHVLASTKTLTSFARDRLQQIQQQNGVPANNLIQSTVIIPPQPPQAQLKSKLQVVLGLLGGGLVSAFMATFITEGLYRSRNRNRGLAGTASAQDDRPAGFALGLDLEATRALERPDVPSMAAYGAPAPRDSPAIEHIAPHQPPANGDRSSNGAPLRDAPTQLILTGLKEQRPTNGHSNENGNGNGKPAGAPVVYRSTSASKRGKDAGHRARD